MKILTKAISFILMLACFQSISSPASAKTNYTTYIYAQITQDNVYLYKDNSSKATSNAYFEIPKSYFVKLLSNIDDMFYKAQYRDVVGYVLKPSVTPVKEIPKTPYLENVTFRVYASNGTNVLSQANAINLATTLGSVDLLEPIDYYGKIGGEEYVEGRGTTWYYCKYSKLSIRGYLYKGYCDDLQAIPLNTENVTPAEYPTFDTDDGYLYNLVNLTAPLKVLLIVLTISPCLVLIYLMFKPFDLEKKRAKIKQSKVKANTLNKIQRVIDDESL